MSPRPVKVRRAGSARTLRMTGSCNEGRVYMGAQPYGEAGRRRLGTGRGGGDDRGVQGRCGSKEEEMTKYQGWKAVLSYNTTGTTYVDIGQVMEIGDIGSTRDLIDVSAYGDEWNDFLGGRQDGSEFTVRIALDPADTTLEDIKDNYDAGGNGEEVPHRAPRHRRTRAGVQRDPDRLPRACLAGHGVGGRDHVQDRRAGGRDLCPCVGRRSSPRGHCASPSRWRFPSGVAPSTSSTSRSPTRSRCRRGRQPAEMPVAVLIAALVDEDEQPIFLPEDKDELAKEAFSVVLQVFSEVAKLNGLTTKELDEAMEAFGPARSESGPTDSPSPSEKGR